MAVRIGVDVGGTFTKAVACDASSGEVIARCAVPTTHEATTGVAQGVVNAIRAVDDEVQRLEAGPVLLVSHSTTQAVNALLEGDTTTVGVIGIGRAPDLRRAAKRTHVGSVRLAPGHELKTLHEFLDATHGLERPAVVAAIRRLIEKGAGAIAVSEAFGVDDARYEWMVVEIAREMGISACAGHELTGLYGLEMRTVTAALNAGILPKTLRTARFVEEAIASDSRHIPLLVMRGDGGASSLEAMRRHPITTAFSGPAASVAGALRHLSLHDGIVVEVGGTSTNISSVRGGRPVLSYVRVLEHTTCVRSLDVRVAGVAGGSMLRIRSTRRGKRLEDIGPRSAHIAGFPYCSFSECDELEGALPILISPRPGDPADYLVLETPSGRRFAPTVTCAANALGVVPDEAAAQGNHDSSRLAFEIAASWLRTDPESLAQEVMDRAAAKVASIVRDVASDSQLRSPKLVGAGGGAGALLPAVASSTELAWTIPPDAPVISSIGDALSLIRVEVERTLPVASADAVAALHAEAEDAAIEAGASPMTIQLTSEAIPERGALRVTAFGSVALQAELDLEATSAASKDELARAEIGECELLSATDHYSVYVGPGRKADRFAVIDRNGSVAVSGRGSLIHGPGHEVASLLRARFEKLVRHFGPIAVAPAVRVLRGSRLVDLTMLSAPAEALDAATAECALGDKEPVVAFITQD